MAPERWFNKWPAGLSYVLRGLVLSVMLLSGAGLVIAVRLAAGNLSTDLSGLVPIVVLVIVIAFLGALRTGRKS